MKYETYLLNNGQHLIKKVQQLTDSFKQYLFLG